MPVRPKNDPLAERLVRMRTKLGLSQTGMAAFFDIDRSTLSTWETFGPPRHGPGRMLVLIVLKRLQKRYEEIRKRENQNAMARPPDDGKRHRSAKAAADYPRASIVGRGTGDLS
jgi:transcriptional regulator with XRE-family HTH domain